MAPANLESALTAERRASSAVPIREAAVASTSAASLALTGAQQLETQVSSAKDFEGVALAGAAAVA